MSSWWHAMAGSLIGTGVGGTVTGLVAEHRARREERQLIVEALAAVRTELLVGVNRIGGSVVSAPTFIQSGQPPPVTDDLSLMYRTHAAVLHARLSANDVLTVTVAYSWLMQYARGGYNTGAASQFISVFDLYMSVAHALYKAYIRMGEILETDYGLPASSEFAVFGLVAYSIATLCEGELKTLSGADANAEERAKVLSIKAFAEWMKSDLQKRGFEGPEIVSSHAKP